MTKQYPTILTKFSPILLDSSESRAYVTKYHSQYTIIINNITVLVRVQNVNGIFDIRYKQYSRFLYQTGIPVTCMVATWYLLLKQTQEDALCIYYVTFDLNQDDYPILAEMLKSQCLIRVMYQLKVKVQEGFSFSKSEDFINDASNFILESYRDNSKIDVKNWHRHH